MFTIKLFGAKKPNGKKRWSILSFCKDAAQMFWMRPKSEKQIQKVVQLVGQITSIYFPSKYEPISVLDMGSDNSDFTSMMLAHFPNANIHFVNFSNEIIETAKPKLDLKRVRFYHLDCKRFPPLKHYDLIICVPSICLTPTRLVNEFTEIKIQHLKSLLKANGKLIFGDLSQQMSIKTRWRRSDVDALMKSLKDHFSMLGEIQIYKDNTNLMILEK